MHSQPFCSVTQVRIGLPLLLLLAALTVHPLHAAAVPKDYPELVRPGGEAIPAEELQTALNNVVHAGVLNLLERASDPRNTTHLVYPPHATWRATGTKTIDRHYRLEKRNIYEEKEIERLEPVKDEYGNVTGYAPKKIKVRVSDKVIGTEEIEVLDPDGPIVHQMTVAVGDASRKMLPRGWYGMNGQGMYILCQAGLGKTEIVRGMATELDRMQTAFGLPDTTWDLAWLAMGFMAMPDDDAVSRKRAKLLLDRLVDGALTEGDRRSTARGLWGPVCINDEVLARFFQLELELNVMFKAADDVPPNATKAQRAAKQKEYILINKALSELSAAQQRIAQQGRRLSDIEKNFALDQDTVTAGLSHYIYNRRIVDLDSTAVVAMALQEAASRKLLPDVTPRDEILGRQILKSGVRTRDALSNAYAAVMGLARRDGGFDTGAQLSPIHAFDSIKNIMGVPLDTQLPPLLHPETWRSNLSAAAAIKALYETMETQRWARSKSSKDSELTELNLQRSNEAIAAWLASDPLSTGMPRPHADESDPRELLDKSLGWPMPVVEKKPKPVAELSVGYQGSPRELLEPLFVLHRGSTDPATTTIARQIAYRLLLEQRADGGWSALASPRSGPMGVSSGEWAYLIGKMSRFQLWFAKEDAARAVKDPISDTIQRQGPWFFRHGDDVGRVEVIANVVVWDEGGPPKDCRWPSSQSMLVSLDVAETLSSLVYLTGQLAKPVTIDAKEIEEITARATEVSDAYDKALSDLQSSDLDEATKAKQVAALEKVGPRLPQSPKFDSSVKIPLWNAILAALGDKRRLSLPTPPAAPAETPAPDGAAPAPAGTEPAPAEPKAEEAPAEPTLDDVLGKPKP